MKRLIHFSLFVLFTASFSFQAWAQFEDEGEYEDVYHMGVIYRMHFDTGEADVLHYFDDQEYLNENPDSIIDILDDVYGFRVTRICAYAFSGCDFLKYVSFPSSLEVIEDHAFEYSSIKNMSAYEGYHGYETSSLSIQEYAFYECPRLETFHAVDMPINEIGDCAFYNCPELRSFSVNTGYGAVTTLGKGCFSRCTSLTYVNIPNSVKVIDNAAFSYCTSLTGISLPDALTTICKFAFAECSNLPRVTLPSTLKIIEDGAFFNCNGLTRITIPNSVTTLGGKCFGACRNLAAVQLGNGVTTIGERAFAGCYAMTGITIPNSVKTIGERAFSGAEFRGATDYDVFYPSLGIMQEGVYDDNGSMTYVTIGSSLETVGQYAFVGHPLQSVIVRAPIPPVLQTGIAIDNPTVFDTNNFDTATLYVPRVMVDVYKAAHEWELFTNIEGFEVLGNGDVNNDNQSNVSDITDMINSLLNEDTSNLNLINADLNGDGVINVTDITILVNNVLAAH